AVTGEVEPYYILLPSAGIAMLAGIVGDTLLSRLPDSSGTARWLSAAALGGLLALALWQLRYSPLLHAYEEWPEADREFRSGLADLERRIALTPDGSVIRARPVARWILPRREGPSFWGASVMVRYTLQAWADLRFPDRRVRVGSSPD